MPNRGRPGGARGGGAPGTEHQGAPGGEVQLVSQPWREAGRTELTTRAVEERLDAYVTALMDTLG